MEDYYLTKNGRIVGKDCLYIVDNSPDCEYEGYIRFRDKITHKVGIFNGKGDVAIPAEYDNLSPVRNGMIMAAKNGKWDATQINEENQYPWVGSKQMLIDIHNKVLVANFSYNEDINFYSLIVSKKPIKNPIWQSFKGVNGKNYSFINFDKEFKLWLTDSLLSRLTESNLRHFSFKNITFWNSPKEWINEKKGRLIHQKFELLRSKLVVVKNPKCKYNVFKGMLSPYICNLKQFKKYYNDCGVSKDWKYPLETIVITYGSGSDLLQDQFGFLRTDAGYRVIEISIRSGTVKG